MTRESWCYKHKYIRAILRELDANRVACLGEFQRAPKTICLVSRKKHAKPRKTLRINIKGRRGKKWESWCGIGARSIIAPKYFRNNPCYWLRYLRAEISLGLRSRVLNNIEQRHFRENLHSRIAYCIVVSSIKVYKQKRERTSHFKLNYIVANKITQRNRRNRNFLKESYAILIASYDSHTCIQRKFYSKNCVKILLRKIPFCKIYCKRKLYLFIVQTGIYNAIRTFITV